MLQITYIADHLFKRDETGDVDFYNAWIARDGVAINE